MCGLNGDWECFLANTGTRAVYLGFVVGDLRVGSGQCPYSWFSLCQKECRGDPERNDPVLFLFLNEEQGYVSWQHCDLLLHTKKPIFLSYHVLGSLKLRTKYPLSSIQTKVYYFPVCIPVCSGESSFPVLSSDVSKRVGTLCPSCQLCKCHDII